MRRLIHNLDQVAGPFRRVIGLFAPAVAELLDLRDHPGCGCLEFADQLDAWGPDECRRRGDEITIALKARAQARGLPCPSWAAGLLLRLAIDAAESTD